MSEKFETYKNPRGFEIIEMPSGDLATMPKNQINFIDLDCYTPPLNQVPPADSSNTTEQGEYDLPKDLYLSEQQMKALKIIETNCGEYYRFLKIKGKIYVLFENIIEDLDVFLKTEATYIFDKIMEKLDEYNGSKDQDNITRIKQQIYKYLSDKLSSLSSCSFTTGQIAFEKLKENTEKKFQDYTQKILAKSQMEDLTCKFSKVSADYSRSIEEIIENMKEKSDLNLEAFTETISKFDPSRFLNLMSFWSLNQIAILLEENFNRLQEQGERFKYYFRLYFNSIDLERLKSYIKVNDLKEDEIYFLKRIFFEYAKAYVSKYSKYDLPELTGLEYIDLYQEYEDFILKFVQEFNLSDSMDRGEFSLTSGSRDPMHHAIQNLLIEKKFMTQQLLLLSDGKTLLEMVTPETLSLYISSITTNLTNLLSNPREFKTLISNKSRYSFFNLYSKLLESLKNLINYAKNLDPELPKQQLEEYENKYYLFKKNFNLLDYEQNQNDSE